MENEKAVTVLKWGNYDHGGGLRSRLLTTSNNSEGYDREHQWEMK